MSNNKIHPYNFEEEEWPKENHSNIREMEVTSNGGGDGENSGSSSSSSSCVSYTIPMRVIDGSESPELWCKFLESLQWEFDNTFRHFENKINAIKRLTTGDARIIVDETLLSTIDPTEKTKNNFECWLIQDRYEKMDKTEWKSYTKSKEYKNDIIEEIIFKLRSCIFGTVPMLCSGCNTLQQHRFWLCTLRFDPTLHGSIRTFSSRCVRLNRYSKFCPSMQTEKRGEESRPFTDEELVEVLDGQLSDATKYQQILRKNGWDLYQHTYSENITKLVEIEESSTVLGKIEYHNKSLNNNNLYDSSFPNDILNSNSNKKRQRKNKKKSKRQRRW